MLIRSERLTLRNWQDSDRTLFAALNADPEVMPDLGGPLDRAAGRIAPPANTAIIGAHREGFDAPGGPASVQAGEGRIGGLARDRGRRTPPRSGVVVGTGFRAARDRSAAA